MNRVKSIKLRKLVTIMIFLCTISIAGQRVSKEANDGYTPAGGAYGAYPLGGFANVNEFSGSLSFALPLLTVNGRGEAGYTMYLRIEPKSSTIRHLDFSPNIATTDPQYHTYFFDSSTYQRRKPFFSPGLIIARRSGALRYGTAPSYTRSCDTLSRLTFVMADGREIELRDRQTNGTPVYNVNDNSVPYNRGQIFDSKDGSSMTFVSDTNIVDVSCSTIAATADTGTLYPSGTMYLPNGVKYRVDNGNVTLITDRNGNQTILEYPHNAALKVTDSIGREILVSSTDTLTTITKKGFNGQERTIKIHNKLIEQALRADQQPQTGRDLFPNIYQCDGGNYGCNVSGGDTFSHGYKPSAVELPNGKMYQFYYNSYGELARVELPTGGAYEYDYTGQYSMNGDNYGSGYSVYSTGEVITRYANYGLHDWAISRRVKKQRTYRENNILESETTYFNETNTYTLINIQLKLRIETRDGAGQLLTLSRAQFKGLPLQSYIDAGRNNPAAYNPEYEGFELKRENYETNGILLRTFENTWEQTGAANKPENERLKEKSITLNDANLVSKQVFGYGPFNNLTDTYDYDFGVGVPGSFLHRTHTEFVTDTNYTSHTGANLRSLPLHAWISSDLAGNNKATLTLYEYDVYTGANHAQLSERQYVSGHDAVNYGTGNVRRGNVTKITTYENAQAGTGQISVYSQYDILGNVVKMIDARGNFSTIHYEDNFGAPDGEARNNTVPLELQPSTEFPQGLNTYAFQKGTVNPKGWVTGYSQVDYYTGQPVDIEDLNGVVNSNFYNDLLDRPTQSIKAANIPSLKRQTSVIYDDTNRRIEVKNDLKSFNDNLLRSESFIDGLARMIESRKYELDGGYIATKIIPHIVIQDPETSTWRLGTKISNLFRSEPNPQLDWTTSLNDSLGRGIKTIASDGSMDKTEYSGNTITVTDQAGKKSRSITNALGNAIRVDEPNASGQLDVNGVAYQPSTYTYDVLGNLINVSQVGTNAEQCGGQATNCIQARSFIYDSLSRMKQATSPESGTTSYLYDNNGNLIRRTDSRQVETNYIYDELNRIINKNYSAPANLPNYQATPNISYTYDNLPNTKGRLTKVENGVSTIEYTEFDQMGRVKKSKQRTADNIGESEYKYNLSGSLIEQIYPSGRVVKNVLDDNGNLETVQSKKNSAYGFWNYAQNFTYTAAGAISAMQLGNFRWESTQFNSRLQPTRIALGTVKYTPQTIGLATNIMQLDYTYNTVANGTPNPDNNGNIVSQTITVPTETRGGTTYTGFTAAQTYTYDGLNRIKQATETVSGQSGINWQQTFNYDRFGNRNFDEALTTTLPKNCNNNTQVCAADRKKFNPSINPLDNRLVPADGYTFDSAGNMTRDAQNRKFTYDGENKQVKVETVDENGSVTGLLGEYWYDGDGKRVKKYSYENEQWVTTIFMYDAPGKLIGEYSTMVETTNPKVSYLTNDHLGSPRITTDQKGQVISRIDFRPFGEEIQRTSYGTDNIRQKFTAHERDRESGLDYMQSRYFANRHGRFTSPDSFSAIGLEEEKFFDYICEPQNWNRYAYVRNNPLAYVDPDGRIAVPVIVWFVVKTIIIRTATGALIGGAINGGIEGGKQVVTEGKVTKKDKVYAATANGAIVGALIGGIGTAGTGGILGSRVIQGGITATAEVVGGTVERRLDGDPNSYPFSKVDMTIDGIAGLGGSGVGNSMKSRLGSRTTQTWISFYKYRLKNSKNPRQLYKAQNELNFLNAWEVGENILLRDFGGELAETFFKEGGNVVKDSGTVTVDYELDDPFVKKKKK